MIPLLIGWVAAPKKRKSQVKAIKAFKLVEKASRVAKRVAVPAKRQQIVKAVFRFLAL